MAKGSAAVEAFREVSHLVAKFFGDPDKPRQHKEIALKEDMCVLVEAMIKESIHTVSLNKPRAVPAPPKRKKTTTDAGLRSAVIDVFDIGAQAWQSGKFDEYIQSTTYDPALGYPVPKEQKMKKNAVSSALDNGTVFDNCEVNVLSYDAYMDLHGDDSELGDGAGGLGALGGGSEFDTGEDVGEAES